MIEFKNDTSNFTLTLNGIIDLTKCILSSQNFKGIKYEENEDKLTDLIEKKLKVVGTEKEFCTEYDNQFIMPVKTFQEILKNTSEELTFIIEKKQLVINSFFKTFLFKNENHFEFDSSVYSKISILSERDVKVNIGKEYIEAFMKSLNKDEKKENIEVFLKTDYPVLFKVKDKWILIAPRVHND